MTNACPLTSVTGDVAVQSRKNQVTVFEILDFTVANDEVAKFVRHGPNLFPLHSIFVRFARRALRCTDSVKIQQWVVCEEEDKSLADRAGGAKDTYIL